MKAETSFPIPSQAQASQQGLARSAPTAAWRFLRRPAEPGRAEPPRRRRSHARSALPTGRAPRKSRVPPTSRVPPRGRPLLAG